MRYAKTIVDLTAQALDKCFTYIIPDNMTVSPGDMVKVPFGNRHIEGFVLEVTDETDVPKDKLKAIEGKAHKNSIILPELIELAKWMKEKYSCTMADALRAMIPSQMRDGRVREKSVRYARLILDAEKARCLCLRSKLQTEIINLLENGEKSLSELNEAVNNATAACNALKAKGIVEISDKRVLRAPKVSDGGRSSTDPVLTVQQASVCEELTSALDGGGKFLLYGVTGSGKTEVYIRLIREVLKRGRGAIILVPEIALTPQTVGWFHARFGSLSAVIHSRLSAGERFDEWERIRRGEAKVVIGARSAVFAPVENPGAIIVDEEHEGAYISERHPRYDAREVAAQRVNYSGGVLVLGSATPSISSFMRTMPKIKPENRLTLLEMDKRASGKGMPECVTVDMREELAGGNKGIFSKTLVDSLTECLNEGHQAMLFINRRGHSTFVSCRACGYVVKCGECDVAMTYHSDENLLKCHYCGNIKPTPKECPECKSKFIKYFGAGTQKIEEEAKRFFPDRRILRMDADTTAGKDGHADILEKFRTGQADILVGTQMIAKGLDFPNVTLVGVVAADTTLNLPDYRSAERTFQLITQVAGRAGRANFPGKVIIQTYTPDAYAIACAVRQDYRAFYNTEVSYRKRSLYPPYTTIARILVTSKDGEKASLAAQTALERLKEKLIQKQIFRHVLTVSVGQAPIKWLRGEQRWQVLVKMYTVGAVNEIELSCEDVISEITQEFESITAELEVNPANMF